MTTDTQLTPTDAEIDELWRFEASKNWDSTLAMRTSFARAVLAKWGQPSGAVEPVAWLVTGPYIKQPMAMRCSAEAYMRGLLKSDPDGGYEISPLYTRPQPMPMTEAQIEALLVNWPEDGIAFFDFARAIERHHGIKGGQHGTE